MKIFEKFKKKAIIHRKGEEILYSIVAQEMERGERNEGLWLKALQESDGNKDRQVAEYIKFRMQSLKDDIEISAIPKMTNPSIDRPARTRPSIDSEPNIENFVTMLTEGSTSEEIRKYLSRMNPTEIQDFINLPDACEDYSLHLSIKKSRLDLTELLLESGANPQLKNYWGKTAVEVAIGMENPEAVALVEKYSI